MSIIRPLPLLDWCQAVASALSEALGLKSEVSHLPRDGVVRVQCGRALVTGYETGRLAAGGPPAERDEALRVLAAAGLVIGWREGSPASGLRQGPGRPEHADPPVGSGLDLRAAVWAGAYGRAAADLLREDPEGSSSERARRAREVADLVVLGLPADAGPPAG